MQEDEREDLDCNARGVRLTAMPAFRQRVGSLTFLKGCPGFPFSPILSSSVRALFLCAPMA